MTSARAVSVKGDREEQGLGMGGPQGSWGTLNAR